MKIKVEMQDKAVRAKLRDLIAISAGNWLAWRNFILNWIWMMCRSSLPGAFSWRVSGVG